MIGLRLTICKSGRESGPVNQRQARGGSQEVLWSLLWTLTVGEFRVEAKAEARCSKKPMALVSSLDVLLEVSWPIAWHLPVLNLSMHQRPGDLLALAPQNSGPARVAGIRCSQGMPSRLLAIPLEWLDRFRSSVLGWKHFLLQQSDGRCPGNGYHVYDEVAAQASNSPGESAIGWAPEHSRMTWGS